MTTIAKINKDSQARAFADMAQFRTGKFLETDAYLEKLRSELLDYAETITEELRRRDKRR